SDPAYFAQFRLDTVHGTVFWPNGADLAPEALHRLPETTISFNLLQDVVDRIRSPDCPADEILAGLQHSSPLIRANAIDRLGRRSPVPPMQAASALESAARDPASSLRLMGTGTLAFVAIAALIRLGGEAADRGLSLIES